MTSKFEPKVWFFLKAIWCAVPDITFKQLCETVTSLTEMKTPTPDSVRKKCKSEKWTKNVRDYCRLADGSLDVIKCRLYDEIKKEYDNLQSDNATLIPGTDDVLLPATGMPDFNFKALENIVYKNRKTIDVLKEHRQRIGKIGQLTDNNIEWLYAACETMAAVEQDPNDMNRAAVFMGLVNTTVEKTEMLSRIAKNLMQMDFALFGINIDDTRDSDTEKRMSAIQDDSVFDRAREALDAQYEDIAKRINWIESGEFENMVQAEMEEQMRREEAESEQYTDDDEGDE